MRAATGGLTKPGRKATRNLMRSVCWASVAATIQASRHISPVGTSIPSKPAASAVPGDVHEVLERRLHAGRRVAEAGLVAHRRHEPQQVHGRRGYAVRARRPRHSRPVASGCDPERPARAVRAVPDGLLPRRRRQDRPLQLDLRAPARRHVRPAHRGHRRRAQPRRVDRRHPERAALDRRRLGRGPVLPEPAHRTCTRDAAARLFADGQRVLLRLHA